MVFRRCGIIAALILLSASLSFAQSDQRDVDIQKLRADLERREGTVERFGEETSSAQSAGVAELDRTNAELIAAENAIVTKLTSGAGGNAEGAPIEIREGDGGRARVVVKDQFPSAAPQLDQLTQKNREQEVVIQTLRSNLSVAQSRADGAEAKLARTSDEISRLKNRLIVAETEVERLSSVLMERNRATVATHAPSIKEREVQLSSGREQAAPVAARLPPAQADSRDAEEMLIATVTSDKAYLRSGPGKDNSPLMSVSKGTRLTVETREGEWYRVITPTGSRAWVSREVVAFGKSATASPSRTVRIQGYGAIR